MSSRQPVNPTGCKMPEQCFRMGIVCLRPQRRPIAENGACGTAQHSGERGRCRRAAAIQMCGTL